VALIGVNNSNPKKIQRKQTNKKRVTPRYGSQTAFQGTRAGKNIGHILLQASNEKKNLKIQAFIL